MPMLMANVIKSDWQTDEPPAVFEASTGHRLNKNYLYGSMHIDGIDYLNKCLKIGSSRLVSRD